MLLSGDGTLVLDLYNCKMSSSIVIEIVISKVFVFIENCLLCAYMLDTLTFKCLNCDFAIYFVSLRK